MSTLRIRISSNTSYPFSIEDVNTKEITNCVSVGIGVPSWTGSDDTTNYIECNGQVSFDGDVANIRHE